MSRILKIQRNIRAAKAGVSVVTLLLYAQTATAQTDLPPITIGASGAAREPAAEPNVPGRFLNRHRNSATAAPPDRRYGKLLVSMPRRSRAAFRMSWPESGHMASTAAFR